MEVKEAYCSYEVSKLLKEKGFDELCIFKYNSDGIKVKAGKAIDEWSNTELEEGECSAPTHQMVMKWLREVHYIHIDIIIEGNGCCIEYKAYIRPFKLIYPTRNYDSIDTIVVGRYNIYEEAVESSIKYCLENLI